MEYNNSSNNSFIVEDNFDGLFFYSRQININSTILITIVGLIGHSLTLFVYMHSKFRTNSGNIFMICLAIIDSLYLLVHLFEDTIRTIIDLYPNEVSDLILFLNIVDRNHIACHLLNYLRNVLRFISAYIIVAFTLQRLYIISKPFSNKFKSKQSAWFTFGLITFFGITLNIWTLFMFEIKQVGIAQYCDIKRNLTKLYLIININYMIIVMIVPIISIFISNILIIVRSGREDNKRSTLMQTKSREETSYNTTLKNSIYRHSNVNTTRIHSNYNQSLMKKNEINNRTYSKRITKLLLIVSFSYSLFNLPYAVTWSVFFSYLRLKDQELNDYNNDIFSIVQICEMPTVLNYGINFFLYCLSGSLFRSQLKYLFQKCFISSYSNKNRRSSKFAIKMQIIR